MPISVLIADDHGMLRQGLRMYLSLDPEIAVVGEASNGAEAVQMARELRPDVVLMDLLMPVMDGVSATSIIRRELPDTQVVALTGVPEDSSVGDVVRAGAIGYLLKDVASAELCRAIRAAAEGQVQLSPQAMARLVHEIDVPDSPPALTEREIEVLRLVAQGCSNKEVGRLLGIAEKTVKNHVARILAKLGLASRTQAALFAVRTGLAAADRSGGQPG
ncbi:MAG: Transcriptional regulatory protein LiaR [Chloroflexi bacterium ADurb.Bin325]|nr:MAG: Transcriptional regulatory protein LiaR [Chloroflexi bacterium ADurb.Bin325]